MRADLLHMTSQRDEALGNLAECQRRCKLVEDELSQTKIKLCKVQQEKVQVERDQRATLSLAKSLQGNVHSDIDYYKRKVWLMWEVCLLSDLSQLCIQEFILSRPCRWTSSTHTSKVWVPFWPKRTGKSRTCAVKWNAACLRIDWLHSGLILPVIGNALLTEAHLEHILKRGIFAFRLWAILKNIDHSVHFFLYCFYPSLFQLSETKDRKLAICLHGTDIS